MISFPTTLNKGGHYFNQPKQSSSVKDSILSSLTTTFKNSINNSISSMTSGRGFDTEGIRYNEDRDYNQQTDLDNRDFSFHDSIIYDNNKLGPQSADNKITFAQTDVESPFHIDNDTLTIMNNYKATINDVIIETGCDSPADKKGANYTTHNYKGTKSTAPSLFNPYFAVLKRGITSNVPLLSGSASWETKNVDASKITDCSIRELIKESSKAGGGVLGQARYRYIDFMYCKDLGKISNNHLITLRRYAHPIGDNIFEASTGGRHDNASVAGDIGRLVAWFNTDDNKLEDILNYDYQATWKELQAKIDRKMSEEDNESRGIMGDIINCLSPRYNLGVGAGGSSASWNRMLDHMGISSVGGTYANNDVALGRNYDNNKVYTPKNTVQDTHIYEGRLVFKQEFSLTFSYKLRAYASINPKSAFLDLLGNILQVTYHTGHFFKGKNQILGPQPNATGWNKANRIVDSVASGVGKFLDNLVSGNFDAIQNQLASMGNSLIDSVSNSKVGKGVSKAANQAASGDIAGAGKTVLNTVGEAAGDIYNKLKDIGVGDAILGLAKNKLGRPAIYAFDSLLPENYTGLWHVTIGNPKNPIVAFGNLILTDAKITHSGPLGLDDFPTELKVTVSLKHARSRDSVEIGKMYTKGENNLYISLASPFTQIQYRNGTSFNSSQYTIKEATSGDKQGTLVARDKKTEETTDAKTGKKTTKTTDDYVNSLDDNLSKEDGNGYSLYAHFGCSAEAFAFNKDQLR